MQEMICKAETRKDDKHTIVWLADTVIKPFAMMIKAFGTSIALSTMLRFLINYIRFTYITIVVSHFVSNVRISFWILNDWISWVGKSCKYARKKRLYKDYSVDRDTSFIYSIVKLLAFYISLIWWSDNESCLKILGCYSIKNTSLENDNTPWKHLKWVEWWIHSMWSSESWSHLYKGFIYDFHLDLRRIRHIYSNRCIFCLLFIVWDWVFFH